MGEVKVSIEVNASIAAVWSALCDIERHIEWMADARSITFNTDQRTGIGTSFDCLTVVGPIRLHDKMVITDWVEGLEIAVDHNGLVTGSGRFKLSRVGRRSSGPTLFEWSEAITYPWFLGGALTNQIGDRLLNFIWTRNLRRFARQFEVPRLAAA